jgi:hypothetical protein
VDEVDEDTVELLVCGLEQRRDDGGARAHELMAEKRLRFLPRREWQGEGEKKRMEVAAHPRWCRARLGLISGPTAGVRSPWRGHAVATACGRSATTASSALNQS